MSVNSCAIAYHHPDEYHYIGVVRNAQPVAQSINKKMVLVNGFYSEFKRSLHFSSEPIHSMDGEVCFLCMILEA
jgi:hypothetical protein